MRGRRSTLWVRSLKNLITDIAGLRVGHADDARLASGVTAIVFDKPVVAAIDVRGGGASSIRDVSNKHDRLWNAGSPGQAGR